MADSVTRKRRLEVDLEDEERRYHKRRDELIQQLDILRDLKRNNQGVTSDSQYQNLLKQYGAESKLHKARQSNLKADFYQLEADELDVNESISHNLEEHAEKYPSPTATRASSRVPFTTLCDTTSLPMRTTTKRVPSNTSTNPPSKHRWSDFVDPPSGADTSESRKLRHDIVGASDRLPTREGLVNSHKAGWWYVDESPSVVQHRPSVHEAFWYVLECGICKTNTVASGEHFRGVTGLFKHVKSSTPCKEMALSRHSNAWEFVLKECLTPLSNLEVDAVFAGTLDFPAKPPISVPHEGRTVVTSAPDPRADTRTKITIDNHACLIKSGLQGWKYVESCPVIVQHEPSEGAKSFYIINCYTCGTNINAREVYFKGILGLRIHLRQRGTRCELLNDDLSKFVMEKCVTPISEDIVLQALNGKFSVPMVHPKPAALDASAVQQKSTARGANEAATTGRSDGEYEASCRSATPGSPSPTLDSIQEVSPRSKSVQEDKPVPACLEPKSVVGHDRPARPVRSYPGTERRESPPIFAHRLASRQALLPQNPWARPHEETMLVSHPQSCPAFERLADGTYTELYCCFCEGNTIFSNGRARFADRMDLSLHLNLQHSLARLGASKNHTSQDQFITDRCTRGSWTVGDFRDGLVRIRPQLLREG